MFTRSQFSVLYVKKRSFWSPLTRNSKLSWPK